MEFLMIIGIIIGLFIGAPSGIIIGGWMEALKPPRIMKQEIKQESQLTTTVRSELKSYQVQETRVYNGLSDLEIIFAITNQTGYSNLLAGIITNTNWSKSTTNFSEQTN